MAHTSFTVESMSKAYNFLEADLKCLALSCANLVQSCYLIVKGYTIYGIRIYLFPCNYFLFSVCDQLRTLVTDLIIEKRLIFGRFD